MTPETEWGESGRRAPSMEEALEALERCLRDATEAVAHLKQSLASEPTIPAVQSAPVVQLVTARPAALDAPAPVVSAEPDVLPRAPDEDPYTPFERLWERMEHERSERALHGSNSEPERHGLELLPQMYTVTVEDRERRVDLVPLHRALLGVRGIEEISLSSYANGVPVVALRASQPIDLGQLRDSVESTLRRACELIPQDTGRIFLRLTSPEKTGV